MSIETGQIFAAWIAKNCPVSHFYYSTTTVNELITYHYRTATG
jgi:hypothetical protein